MLSAAQMAQMSRLLDQALELDQEGRRQWLEALPPEDRELLPALRQALLWDEDNASGRDELITLPGVSGPYQARPTGNELQLGDTVGPYRLIRRLGAGGMAEVWLAERADGALKREVALKVPMHSNHRRDLASRFARERDILAGLEHPNIARLYDAGVTAEGLPYLAMEYVDGEPLTAWCNARRLGIRERVKLFLQVLDALQYAHSRHVIHRDIKPSNILVTKAGQVRLLDFGVAKLLAQEVDRTDLTQVYGQALTPEYACPELVRGDPVEAVADVYSLGVVLYELMCGNRPYRLTAGSSITLLEQAIATAQVERPSTRLGPEAGIDRSTTQHKLARGLRGDLDAIVLKALAKAPESRYPSVAALKDDLQRYLTGQPVRARRDRWMYRVAKFVQRHRTGVAMAMAAVLLLSATIGYELTRPEAVSSDRSGTIGGPGRLGAAAVSLAANDKSIAVLPFLDMSEKRDQEYFSDGLTEELIDRLAHSPNLKVTARTSSFAFKGRDEDVRTIGSQLGVAHLLEGSVRKSGQALRITAQLVRASDGMYLWSQTYDSSLNDIFKVQDEIAGNVAQALKIALNAEDKRKARWQADTQAYNLLLMGNFFLERGNKGDNQKAIELYQRAIKRDPDYSLAWLGLARTYVWQGISAELPVAQAESRAREALQRTLAIDPDLASAHAVLGTILRSFDWNWEAAKAEYERGIALDPNGEDTIRARIGLLRLTACSTGRYDDLVNLLLQYSAQNPLDTDTLHRLGAFQFLSGHLEESAAAFRKLLDFNPTYASGWASYAGTLLWMGRYQEALDALQKESDEVSRLPVLPAVYWAMGRRSESEAALNELQDKYAQLAPAAIAEAHAYRGEAGAAFEWLDRAFEKRDPALLDIKFDPYLRSLRNDARFQALVVRMHLDGGPADSRL